MQLNVKTILNLKERHSHFVYRDVRLTGAEYPRIEVTVEPRRGSKGICSGCGKACPGYDRLPQRRFTRVPLWGIAVISCTACAVSLVPRAA
jgi:transposase